MKYLLLSVLVTVLLQCQPTTPPAAPTTITTEEATTNPDKAAIEAVINNYFDGWLTGDTTLVGSAMHSSCHLKFARDGQILKRNRTEYLSNFQPRPRLPNAEGRILSIDIVLTAAAAKVELETETRLFTDYFNLLKEGDRWYITDKVSTNLTK
ncbi:MAG: nuclear transport factor 2 family protein [Bacteroidota bacterium]